MTWFALRNLFARRIRAAMTGVAVLVGVAMISGTLVFTDTINQAFRELFANASRGADVVVSSRQNFNSGTAPASIPASLLDRIRALEGVASADGQISDVATIVDRSGHVIKSTGSPTLALSYVAPPFSGLTFVAGRPPANSSEVSIDQATAERQHYRIGDVVPIVTGQPVRSFRISGVARLGSASLGGATFAVFDLHTARALYGKEGKLDLVYAAAVKGVKPDALLTRIRPLLLPELVARTATAKVGSDVNRISGQLQILTTGLLAFSLIAVFVGAFVIFNTFSITIAQRMQEFALLRAVGATRWQVLGSVLAEAAGLGAIASLGGVAAGLFAAGGIRALLKAIGFDLPSTGLVLEPRTVLIAVAVGVVVTVVAGLVPALRATHAAPLEALRESEAPPRRTRLRMSLTAAPAAVLGVAGLLFIFTSSGSSDERLRQSAIGAVMLVLAIVALSPFAVRRLTAVVSWPLKHRDLVLGELARENAARNPNRTAVSASSLMIGLALVLFVTVYANGLHASTNTIIDQTFVGDYTIENSDGTSAIPASSVRAVASVPGVLAVSSLKSATAQLPSAGQVTAEGIDPNTIAQVYRFEWLQGSPGTLDTLSLGDAIMERDTARSAHLRVGDRAVITTETGLRSTITVRGIYRDRALLRGVALPRVEFDALFHQERLQGLFVKLDGSVDRAAAGAQLRQALTPFPGVVARSQQQLKDEVAGRVNSILVLFYALLAMSVLMALLGIVNTLTLSIHERTRELGLLRALGMTARQARILVRDESLITAAIGTVVGVLLGIFLAFIVTRALASDGIVFVVPWLQVLGLLVLGVLAGVLAGVPPAARAARLDVLAAIAHE